MRTPLLALLIFSAPAYATPEPVDTPSKVKPAEPTFPIPKDATGGDSQPGGGGKIVMYQVPRGRDAVVKEVKKALETGGWTITKDDPSPSGRAIRIEVKSKTAKLYKVSFTGDDSRTAIILTLPD
jgi:hypothetical protein